MSNKILRYSFCMLFVGVGLGISFKAQALLPFGATPEEKKALPAYCRGSKPKIPTYYLNHYCYGLNFVNRANRSFSNQKEEKAYLGSAMGEFEAAIGHTEQRNADGRYNAYLGIVSRSLGEVYERLGKRFDAISAYQKSIRYLPKQTQAYSRLSEIYKKLGMNKEAREILVQGLKQVPKSKSLKRKLTKLPAE